MARSVIQIYIRIYESFPQDRKCLASDVFFQIFFSLKVAREKNRKFFSGFCPGSSIGFRGIPKGFVFAVQTKEKFFPEDKMCIYEFLTDIFCSQSKRTFSCEFFHKNKSDHNPSRIQIGFQWKGPTTDRTIVSFAKLNPFAFAKESFF